MRATLQRVVRENPEYLFTILEASQQPGGSGYSPPEEQSSWCICTFCREMPAQRERLCCQRNQDGCISRLPDFDILILNEAVLALARLYRQDILAQPDDGDRNKANRHTAYRQFVLWHHGRLGTGDRRVLPSCCIWRIRDKFPDQFGQYTGFKDDPLQ
ncbi:P2X purinoceptor 7-like [Ostrea edulis]|uniref:P2X purinoceptor 7-like n=1 Tax=Ostrea edulis TaxID=37623 RepID=UPI0020945D15|nr:P2X purinoceptor 7-like [Ostrea edulis]